MRQVSFIAASVSLALGLGGMWLVGGWGFGLSAISYRVTRTQSWRGRAIA